MLPDYKHGTMMVLDGLSMKSLTHYCVFPWSMDRWIAPPEPSPISPAVTGTPDEQRIKKHLIP